MGLGYRRGYGRLAKTMAYAGAGMAAGYIARRFKRGSRARRVPIKRVVRRRVVRRSTKRKAPASSRTFKRRRTSRQVSPGNELTRSKRSLRYSKPTLKKFLYPSSKYTVDRFQGLTNFDTNGGWNRLSNMSEGTGVWAPMHIYDLTSFNNGGSAPQFAQMIGWADTGNTSINKYAPLYGTNANGNSLTAEWTPEKGFTPYVAGQVVKKVYLKWIDVRLNLYGARKRTTKFDVMFVQFTNPRATIFPGVDVGASEARDLAAYLERPLIYSNLQTGEYHGEKIKVIRRYSYTVQPTTSIDLNTTTGKIHEAKIFVPMNKAMNLDWQNPNNYAHASVSDGMDYTQHLGPANNQSGPVYRSRVYMIIMAFSPERKSADAVSFPQYTPVVASIGGGVGTPLDTSTEPSYDILIRRKYFSDQAT